MSGKAPHTIGLTGSIGMGKSTVSGFFADVGVAVWDADEAVHRLYDINGAGVEAILAPFVLFDIPLLFEGDMVKQFDTIVVVSAPFDVQKSRVLARDGMTPEKFEFILSRQMPDQQKRELADFVIETDGSFDDTREQVHQILEKLRSQ